jgi:signal transduction histidine kinase
LSGYSRAQLSDIDTWIHLAGQERAIAGKQLIHDNFKLQAMTRKGEFPLCTASGEERIWDFYSGPMGVDSKGQRLVISTAVDVTDRTKAEKALREREEELARLNQRKDEFLATLAHELRNPLAPIRTGLEVMKLSRELPPALEEVRKMMERQTLQLVSLVDDLMEVSRITRGKLELRKRLVLLSDVVKTAVEASRPFLDTTHRLSIELPGKPIHLEVDPNVLPKRFRTFSIMPRNTLLARAVSG